MLSDWVGTDIWCSEVTMLPKHSSRQIRYAGSVTMSRGIRQDWYPFASGCCDFGKVFPARILGRGILLCVSLCKSTGKVLLHLRWWQGCEIVAFRNLLLGPRPESRGRHVVYKKMLRSLEYFNEYFVLVEASDQWGIPLLCPRSNVWLMF